MIKTLRGPNGIRIELDSSEVVPNDPGAGTPAMVYLGNDCATFWCAMDYGCLQDDTELSERQSRWLDEQEETVNAFVEAYS